MDLYTDDIERVLGGTLVEQVKGKEALRPLYESLPLPNRDGGKGAPAAQQLATYEVKHFITGIVVDVRGDEASAVAALHDLCRGGDRRPAPAGDARRLVRVPFPPDAGGLEVLLHAGRLGERTKPDVPAAVSRHP